jgi:hypothetical protein
MTIEEIQQKTIPIFQKYGITYAGLYGSFARGQSTEKSDIDFIVHFGVPMSMFVYMKFVHSLEEQLQRKVDVVTENSLNKRVKPYIIDEIKTIYGK